MNQSCACWHDIYTWRWEYIHRDCARWCDIPTCGGNMFTGQWTAGGEKSPSFQGSQEQKSPPLQEWVGCSQAPTLLVWFGLIPGPLTSSGTLISNSYSCLLSIGKENCPETKHTKSMQTRTLAAHTSSEPLRNWKKCPFKICLLHVHVCVYVCICVKVCHTCACPWRLKEMLDLQELELQVTWHGYRGLSSGPSAALHWAASPAP